MMMMMLMLLLLWVTWLMVTVTMLEAKVMLPPLTLWIVLLSPTMSSPISTDTSGHRRALACCTAGEVVVAVVVKQNSDLYK